MAMIKCSECGKDVSSKAKSCIYCGNPILLANINFEIDEKTIEKYRLNKQDIRYLQKYGDEIDAKDVKQFQKTFQKWLVAGITISSLLLLIPYIKYRDLGKLRCAKIYLTAFIAYLIIRFIAILLVIHYLFIFEYANYISISAYLQTVF